MLNTEEGYKEKRAEKLAEFIHYGQKRKSGEDYIEHPRNVASAIKRLGYGENVVCAAWLHDVEDFEFLDIILDLIDKVFGHEVFIIVLLLTHEPKDVPYNDYIYGIAKASKEAMAIKWQDMIDNTKGDVPKKQWEKYRNAVIFLQSKGIEIPEILKGRLKI